MIRVDNLMVGDWLLDGDSYAQVTSIACGGIIETTASNFAPEEVLQPIPLTPEILVLNGYETLPTAPHNYFNSDLWDYDVIINISKDTYEDTWHVNNFTDHNDNVFVRFTLCYVHELQHALRLCGLTELADNFKVEDKQ